MLLALQAVLWHQVRTLISVGNLLDSRNWDIELSNYRGSWEKAMAEVNTEIKL